MGLLKFLKPIWSSLVDSANENIGKEIIYRARAEANIIQRKLVKSIISTFILLLSFVFLAISALFFLIDYAHVVKSLAFLIIGIIILVAGIIAKL